MSDIQKDKNVKAKKKKKKSKTPEQSLAPAILTSSEGASNSAFQLPKTADQKTYYNEVEVTLKLPKEPQANVSNINDGKKNYHGIAPVVAEPYPVTASKNSPALNVTQSGNIELSNRPEITVLRTENIHKSSVKPIPESSAAVEQPATVSTPSEDNTNTQTAKKKKKKKKNKASTPEQSTEQKSNDMSNSEPTYVKLPGTGDNYVLLVSHESFKGTDTQKQDTAANGASVNVSISENSPVGIFPVSEAGTALPLATQGDSTTKMEQNGGLAKLNCNDSSKVNATDANLQVDGKKNVHNKKSQKLAEDQALQEVQLVATMAKKFCEMSEGPKDGSAKVPVPKTAKEGDKKPSQGKIRYLFSHLPQYKLFSAAKLLESYPQIHHAIAAVGVQCAEGIVSGSDSRCVAILAALIEFIKDYKTPPSKELRRNLQSSFDFCVKFVSECRPLSVSMSNAIKYLKQQVTNIPTTSSGDEEAKDFLVQQIGKFIEEEIYLAKKAISSSASEKIVDDDVILTYGHSSVVKDVLHEAHSKGKNFKVIVVDSEPKMEGREMLRSLVKQGMQCSYILISGISYVMKEVSKIFIGAHSLQANGYVMSRIGSSQIALVASSYNVPVLVCCETYKFSERVHTDSFVYNELGNPESFNSKCSITEDWNLYPQLNLLNPLYDITPPHLVSMVITEKGMLPCTSVPVVLRVRHAGCPYEQK